VKTVKVAEEHTAVSARTAEQIVAQTEELAAALNTWRWGGRLESGTYRTTPNPKAQWCWQMACKAQELLTATDPENAVSELEDLPAEPKLYGSVGIIYRGSVTVPIKLYEAIGHLPAYDQQALTAARVCSGATGQNSYSQIEEWCEGPDRAECEAFVAHWSKFITEQLVLLQKGDS
jgi:hypothetical protein